MKHLIPLIIVVFLISCKKEGANFPQSLYLKKVTALSNVRLYINKIEILDKSIIDSFIKRTNIFNLQNQTIDPTSNVTFISIDTATFDSPTVKYSVSLNGSQFIFKSPAYFTTQNLFPEGILAYPPKITPVPNTGYLISEMIVGNGNFLNLDISLFTYSLSRGNVNSGYFQTSAEKIFNQFNHNFINTLNQTDTLAIQEFTAKFKAN
jgi:hypothetical protein